MTFPQTNVFYKMKMKMNGWNDEPDVKKVYIFLYLFFILSKSIKNFLGAVGFCDQTDQIDQVPNNSQELTISAWLGKTWLNCVVSAVSQL